MVAWRLWCTGAAVPWWPWRPGVVRVVLVVVVVVVVVAGAWRAVVRLGPRSLVFRLGRAVVRVARVVRGAVVRWARVVRGAERRMRGMMIGWLVLIVVVVVLVDVVVEVFGSK